MSSHHLTHEQAQTRLTQIYALLQSPLASSILATHPNDLVEESDVPSEWDWWSSYGSDSCPQDETGGDNEEEWVDLVNHYNGTGTRTAYTELNKLVDQIRVLELTRDPISVSSTSSSQNGKHTAYGMSPKKTHEVSRMSAFVESLLSLSHLPGDEHGRSRTRVVDVGAGQGYLTRALAYLPCHPRLLALDGDAAQTTGAERWETRSQKRTKVASEQAGEPRELTDAITHKTIHITPETLIDAVDEWIPSGEEDGVVYVALHACGSLTPSVLRAMLLRIKGSRSGSHGWTVSGAVVVGCCYNLMEASDFPLSRTLKRGHALPLPIAHRHLAAQIPGTWLHLQNDKLNIKPDARLAIRKVVWRAILGRMIASLPSTTSSPLSPLSITLVGATTKEHASTSYPRRPTTDEGCGMEGTGETPTHARLGKINDRHYASWDTFTSAAGERMGMDFTSSSFTTENDRHQTETRLATLHVMRCLLGPLVESLILLDRLIWVREQLEDMGEMEFEVELANLFDQRTGSGRNVAIVIKPKRAGNDGVLDGACAKS
ncbi:hypothetical protein HWV62_2928 [Athelia sp. TMB]|nr:hypothetical protein HWV62_2928 [Athelia sp. TMB]